MKVIAKEFSTALDDKIKKSILMTKLVKNIDEDLSSFRYTIDYPEDLEVFRLIYTELERKGIFGHTADIVSELKDNKAIRDLNSFHFAGEGWEKYNE